MMSICMISNNCLQVAEDQESSYWQMLGLLFEQFDGLVAGKASHYKGCSFNILYLRTARDTMIMASISN